KKSKGWRQSKVLVIGFLALIFLVIGVYAAWQNTQPPNESELPPLYVLTDADFSEFRGKIVLVDCFATWCQPCIMQFDHLKEVNDKYNSSEVVVVSVGSSGDSITGLRQFKKDYNMDWLVARDTVGVFDKYDARSIPTLVILNQNGDTHYRTVGLTDASVLMSKIDELLGP
ncbi:redoxin family protein, partial [Candidatus Bathyarchaeota archaeon]|nr:redoxin family protein [Candidatus Bathyarchaeota archaeon]